MAACAVRCARAMMEERERRAVPRLPLTEHPSAEVRGLRAVHVLDLSPAGAQVEHLGVFRPGAPCALDLPPHLGALSLPAQVVWCTVIGRKRKVGGESHLVARSGQHLHRIHRTRPATDV